MSTSAPSNSTDLSSQLSDYYLWEEPYRGIKIGLSMDTVDRLQIRVLRGIEGFPVENAEVGGILLGRTEPSGDQTITLIEDFATVDCSYRGGPLYRLSEKDAANLEAALAQCPDGNRGLSIVGYFRSHNRDDLFLSADDLKLIHKYFPEQDKVFLLVKTLPSRACTAGFFFWENGTIQSEFTYLEVPFGPIQSIPPGEATRGPAVNFDNLPLPGDEHRAQNLQPTTLQPSEVPSNQRAWLVRCAAGAALVMSFAGVGYWLSDRPHVQRMSSPPNTTLGLNVQRKAGALTLTWNPSARDILVADEAILYINEGIRQKSVRLGPSQLRSGEITFSPTSDDIELRLEIDRGGKPSAAERVHLLLADSSVGASEREPGQNDPHSVASLPHTISGKLDQHPPAKTSNPAAASPKPFQFVAPARSTQFPNGVIPTISEIQFDQPPSIAMETKASDLIVASATARPVAPPPPNNPMEHVIERAPTALSAAPATPTPPVVSSYIGPRLLKQVNPSIPLDLRSKITSDVQIDVAVTIDVNGKVADAKVASMKGSVARFVSGQVLQASRLFQFHPAQDNNRNVESKMILTFRFSASQLNERSTK